MKLKLFEPKMNPINCYISEKYQLHNKTTSWYVWEFFDFIKRERSEHSSSRPGAHCRTGVADKASLEIFRTRMEILHFFAMFHFLFSF